MTASKKNSKTDMKRAEKDLHEKNHLKNKKDKTHSEKKVFECEICDKRFSRRYHFEEHTRIHTDEKPFECTVCGKAFTQKSKFDRHTRLSYW